MTSLLLLRLPSLRRALPLLCALAVLPTIGAAQSDEDLAKQLANPVAILISVPLQYNWDRNIGPLEDGRRYTLNIQPVIPVSIGRDWNLINRVILPVIDQSNVLPGAGSQFGLGDTVASFFFSPKVPTSGGWIWGARLAVTLLFPK